MTLEILQGPAFSAAGKAMGELAIAGCVGSECVRQQLITADMVQSLSKTIFSVLLPMFLCTNVMKSAVTYGITVSTLGVPALSILHALLLYVLSSQLIVPILFGLDPTSDEGRSTIVSCSWGNAGVVPLIFAEALFRRDPSLLSRCYTNVSMFLVGWSPFFWSFGRSVLIDSSSVENKDPVVNKSIKFSYIKRLFPPPVKGVTAGLVIALSPLCPLFLAKEKGGPIPPLSILYNTFENLGRAANPLALLVLTCSLALGASSSLNSSTLVSKRNNRNGGDGETSRSSKAFSTATMWKRWGSVSLSRFFISPIVMLSLLKLMSHLGLLDSSEQNPMLWFVLILESCMPPAQNSVLMLQVANKAHEATQMARFLFLTYATSMIPIVLVVSIALKSLALI